MSLTYIEKVSLCLDLSFSSWEILRFLRFFENFLVLASVMAKEANVDFLFWYLNEALDFLLCFAMDPTSNILLLFIIFKS